jgi:pimeloyl-ACP methyl ester carboxylesterase
MRLIASARIRTYLKWTLWVLVAQVLLMNISAALYAYKFTHFYDPSPQRPPLVTQDVFGRTWQLFSGPKIYKSARLQEPAFPFENVNLQLNEGTAISGWYSSVDNPKGCVILFHGLMVNKSFLVSEAEMFRVLGYNVLLVDFRAHGQSGGNTSTFGIEETSEVQKAFEYAKSRGNGNIILYGVSMGAAACLKAVSENKVQPSAIIADMPFGCLQSHLEARARIQGFPSQPFGFLVTMWSGIERGYNGFNHRPSEYALKVNCPVLLQWGDHDPYVLRSETESLFQNLQGKKRLSVYEGAGHESFLTRDPMQWEAEVISFLRGV